MFVDYQALRARGFKDRPDKLIVTFVASEYDIPYIRDKCVSIICYRESHSRLCVGYCGRRFRLTSEEFDTLLTIIPKVSEDLNKKEKHIIGHKMFDAVLGKFLIEEVRESAQDI